MKKTLISAREVSKTFNQYSTPNEVLNKVDIDIYAGDFTMIMGPSGAGKSTLLYTLSGIDKITSGKVIYKDQEMSKYSENQMAKLRSEEFGFIFQQSNLVSNLTLFENIAIAGYLNKKYSARQVQERTHKLLDMMDIKKVKNNLSSQVSGGEAQRAAIARAMIHQPELIFADEPTGSLNRKNSEEVLNLLTKMNEAGQSILMVTHDLHAAIRGTRLLYIEDGKVIDEITLLPFTGKDIKEREEKVSAWLSSLAW